MRRTKKYYVDEKQNMIGYTGRYRFEKTEKPAEMFHAKLKISKVGWLNNGFYFVLEDVNGKTYCMSDVLFREYIEKNDVFVEGDWNFYQQGTAFSIGL